MQSKYLCHILRRTHISYVISPRQIPFIICHLLFRDFCPHHLAGSFSILSRILDSVIILSVYTDLDIVLRFFLAQADYRLHMYCMGKIYPQRFKVFDLPNPRTGLIKHIQDIVNQDFTGYHCSCIQIKVIPVHSIINPACGHCA